MLAKGKTNGLQRRTVLRGVATGGVLAAGALAGSMLDSLWGRSAQANAAAGPEQPAAPQAAPTFATERGKPPHVVLAGDSTLDNAAYVPSGQAVIDQLHRLIPFGWQATLLAQDGARTTSVAQQLARLPATATHLVISVGGNDALGYSGLLSETTASAAAALERLADIQAEFQQRYAAMLAAAQKPGLPTLLCTIYYPNYPEPTMQRLASTAETIFNDVILRVAFAHALPVLDLRLLFTEKRDYANAIEPSAQGGVKIARGIVRIVQEHDFSRRHSEVFAAS